MVSKKMLRDKGKLALMWGQFNPNIPEKGFERTHKESQEKWTT